MSSLHQFIGYWSLCSFLQGSCMQITKMLFQISNTWGQWWKGGRQKKPSLIVRSLNNLNFTYICFIYELSIHLWKDKQGCLTLKTLVAWQQSEWDQGLQEGLCPNARSTGAGNRRPTQLTPRTAATQLQTACCPSRHRVPVGKVTLLLTS